MSDISHVSQQLITIKKNSLARQLLAKEKKGCTAPRDNAFVQELVSLAQLTEKYKDNALQEAVLEAIPFEEIYGKVESILAEQNRSLSTEHTDKEQNDSASTKQSDSSANKQSDDPSSKLSELPAYQDILVKEILRWFKEDFFTWVNKETCAACGNRSEEKIQSLGAQPASPTERAFGARIVEMYACDVCGARYRFPRYNDPKKLIETRKGRCGEFANCFYAVLYALGSVKVRYVWNREDHVWTEYYSAHFKRWIHLDSCENAYDQPHLYCEGWGKQMSYVFGIWDYGFVDLSEKYVTRNKLPRDLIAEKDLKSLVEYLDVMKKRQIEDLDLLYGVYLMDKREQRELAGENATKSAAVSRITGSAEWKASRGEDGR